ncbi:General amino-acid permease [Lachnellula hyalina]|uniref:General amino-acid permease n=1 Tax=Lachnellula hyalina TaxID=1316788 RepID=A0A8H8R675_9HELO|nr:General amino-acid permease [Lachnellula hyalina]TVY27589.1 General amino-acid permease [Lachnellula hyalina]
MEPQVSYTGSTSTVLPLLARPKGAKLFSAKAFDNFRSGPTGDFHPALGEGGRVFDAKAAAYNTANTHLVRRLKGRHLQMIAIGGSIGTGLFVGSGQALATGGPGSLLLGFIIIGSVLFCTVQALGEMTVTFPVAGSFNAYATRFIDPAWGFASGWNYAMQWLILMPLEIMAASLTLEYWSLPIPGWASISVFLGIIIFINLCGVKVYGEVEYCFSIMKVTAVIGFIILGVVINCGGGPGSGYIGGKYWDDPGAFNHGFKGFCNILVTAAFSFGGTELVGLAAAETHNPSRALPTAIKQVFWRIAIFYVISIAVVGLIVPYTSSQLISRNSVDSKASPFIIAIKDAGIQGLDSVMNAVVMMAVLSVANSSMYGATRTLAALAEQGQAPRILAYVDRKGRPLVSIGLASLVGLLAYLYVSPIKGPAFTWLLALSGLSSIFTWGSICFAHIQFRKAWLQQGNTLSDLIYKSPIGSAGSWIGLISLTLILVAQIWVAISPSGGTQDTVGGQVADFFEACLAMPVVILSYVFYKIWYRTKWVRIRDVDLKTGRNDCESDFIRQRWKEDRSLWPRWKVIYKTLC